jgi:hypothetical protein
VPELLLGDLDRHAKVLEIGLWCVEQMHAEVRAGKNRGKCCRSSCVMVAVSWPSVATRATCSRHRGVPHISGYDSRPGQAAAAGVIQSRDA